MFPRRQEQAVDIGRERVKPRELPVTHGFLLLGVQRELLGRVVSDGLQKRPACLSLCRHGHDQPLFLQSEQQAADLGLAGVGQRDGTGGRRVPAPIERRQAPKQHALGLIKQPVAPIQRCSDRAMLRQRAPVRRSSEASSTRKPIRDLARCKALDASGGEPECERQAVQLMTDPHHRPSRRRRQCKARVSSRRAIDKEPPRVRAHHRCDITAGLRKTQRRQREHQLPCNPQRLSTCRQHSQHRYSVEQLPHQAPHLVSHVLAVVHHQHAATAREAVEDAPPSASAPHAPLCRALATARRQRDRLNGPSPARRPRRRMTRLEPTMRPASSRATLVLPHPPAPVTVTSRAEPTACSSASNSDSRPISGPSSSIVADRFRNEATSG